MKHNPIRDFVYSFKNQSILQTPYPQPHFLFRLASLIQFWGLGTVLAFTLGIFSNIMLRLLFGETLQTDQNVISQEIASGNIIYLLIFATIYAPVVEELAFRGWIVKSKKWFFTLCFALWLAYLPIFQSSLVVFGFITLLCIAIVLLVVYLLPNTYKKITQYIQDHPRLFLHITAVSFGLIHVSNYINVPYIWILAPLLVLPQIALGYILGFVRHKFGLLQTIIAHALHNFATMFMFVILAIGDSRLLTMLDNQAELEQLAANSTQANITLIVFNIYFLALAVLALGVTIINIVLVFVKESN